MREDDTELLRQLVEQERARVNPQVLPAVVRPTLHYTELPENTSGGPLSTEWNYYRQIIGRLLAEGHEGKWVLIQGNELIGIWETEAECDRERLKRFLMQPVFMKQV